MLLKFSELFRPESFLSTCSQPAYNTKTCIKKIIEYPYLCRLKFGE